MSTKLTDNGKAAIFTVIVLLLAVAVAASISLLHRLGVPLHSPLHVHPCPDNTDHDAGGHP
jgi:hypothetical protein